ncbi:MAG: macrolide ABC transporter ATP-binding protein [Campylobacteraceae bacterium 4484_4]|nr:MAG: macrolide ABC transporter ATP-binding protein [Campylobacteraceae bacterium 4484_4]
MIDLRKIVKYYGAGEARTEVLKGIDLKVEKGEFLAIMGPSGSGKSTLMHIIGCLDRPSSGAYLYRGRRLDLLDNDQRAYFRRYKIGFVFQGYNLLKKTTALENVEMPLVYQGKRMKERRALAKKALESVGLGNRLYYEPNELSGGQQQRVAIARAIVTAPALLIADEPTGNLDTATSHEIMKLLTRLHQEGNTIIIVTHENDIAAYAGRVIHLRDGMIVREQNHVH